MENNNDPSTGSGTNKNPNVEELSDEQLNKVAGGMVRCPPLTVGCTSTSSTSCDCQTCRDGFVLVSGKCEYQGQVMKH